MTCQAAVACSWYRTCLRRVCGGRAIVTQTNVTCRRASQPAALRVFLPWQVPRNNIATPSLLGRSQTTQVRCLCVAQVGAHVRARASSQYAEPCTPRRARASRVRVHAPAASPTAHHVGQQPCAAVCVTVGIVLARQMLIGTLIRLITACMLNHCALTCKSYCVEVGL